MKCPNCGAKIDELTEVCPECKINLDEFETEENQEEEQEEIAGKTSLLKIINVLQAIGFVIGTFICWGNEDTVSGFIFLGIALVTFAFIKGFIDIIDLLDSINDNLKK